MHSSFVNNQLYYGLSTLNVVFPSQHRRTSASSSSQALQSSVIMPKISFMSFQFVLNSELVSFLDIDGRQLLPVKPLQQ